MLHFWNQMAHNMQLENNQATSKNIHMPPRNLKKYPLYAQKNHPYLTEREAQCAAFLMVDCTLKEIGACLNLSPRTIEFYVNNMKQKLNCLNRQHLIDLLENSHFFHEAAHLRVTLRDEKIDAQSQPLRKIPKYLQ